MDWLIGLLLLLVGGMIGFFVSQFFNKEKKKYIFQSSKRANRSRVNEPAS